IEGGGWAVSTAGAAQPPPPSPPLKGEGSDRSWLDASTTSPLAGEAGRGDAASSNPSVVLPSPLWGGGTMRSMVGGGGEPWTHLWSALHHLITDSDQNLSNRFDVAEQL